MRNSLNRVEFVLRKYRLAESTFLETKQDGVLLGHGKIMADETFQKFLDNDPSGNHKYLDWMLFQAGGGQRAMARSLSLWHGADDSDPASLHSLCRADFMVEHLAGYSDAEGYHAPVSEVEAETAWKIREPVCKRESLMADQQVAFYDHYGFYRHWPGKDANYLKIVNAVKLWHSAQPQMLALHKNRQRYFELTRRPAVRRTVAENRFVSKHCANVPESGVVLDIYAGWKPSAYSQAVAVYKDLSDLLRGLAWVHKAQVLRDTRSETIYEDHAVKVVCPLTVGASLELGISKWCVSNLTEFNRSFNNPSSSAGQWQRYSAEGPLVFMIWKGRMPAWLHKIALHIRRSALRRLSGNWTDVVWTDCQNLRTPTCYAEVLARLQDEHLTESSCPSVMLNWRTPIGLPEETESAFDTYSYQWGRRAPGPAWKDAQTGKDVIASFKEALAAIQRWARTFDPERIVVDYITDITAGV